VRVCDCGGGETLNRREHMGGKKTGRCMRPISPPMDHNTCSLVVPHQHNPRMQRLGGSSLCKRPRSGWTLDTTCMRHTRPAHCVASAQAVGNRRSSPKPWKSEEGFEYGSVCKNKCKRVRTNGREQSVLCRWGGCVQGIRVHEKPESES